MKLVSVNHEDLVVRSYKYITTIRNQVSIPVWLQVDHTIYFVSSRSLQQIYDHIYDQMWDEL